MNAKSAVEFYPTTLLDVAGSVEKSSALTAWFQKSPQATQKDCYA